MTRVPFACHQRIKLSSCNKTPFNMAIPVYITTQSRVRITTLVGLVDAIPESTLSRSKKITQHPLEDGSVISDHVIETPVNIRLNVFISDIFNQAGRGATFIVEGEEKQQQAWAAIQEIYENSTFLEVQTPYELLENMIIDNFRWARSNSTGRGLGIELSLTRVKIIDRSTSDGDIVLTGDDGREDDNQDRDVGDRSGGDEDGEERGLQRLEDGEFLVPLNNNSKQVFYLTFDYYGTLSDHDRPRHHSLKRQFVLQWFPFTESWMLDIYDVNEDALILAHRLTAGDQVIRPTWRRISIYTVPVLVGKLEVRGEEEIIGRNAWTTTHRLIYKEPD